MKPEISFPLGDRVVARDGGLFFIFEMANSHQGSVEHGLKILDALGEIARRKNISAAIKFQFRQLDTFLHPGFLKLGLSRSSNKHSRRFMETRLGFEDYQEMVRAAREKGLIPLATPFDESSVEWCEKMNLPAIKIASSSANDWPLLQRVVRARRPVLCSTGGLSLRQVDDAVNFFTRNAVPLGILHCVGVYPAPREHLRLDQIRQFRERYPHLVIGYSAHEGVEDMDAGALAVAGGAAILERHVGLSTETISLNAYSLGPEDLEKWVEMALRASRAMGRGQERTGREEEVSALGELKRGIYVKADKQPGEFLEPGELFLAMPCLPGQFCAAELDDVIGLPVPHQGIAALMPVMKNRKNAVPPEVILVSIVEKVRQMAADSKIPLADGTAVEVSHPYGLENFHKSGAVLVDIVNREYCKKLILQLPGQEHPSHKHSLKEETFHLMAGEVEAEVDGEVKALQPGDRLTICRDQLHGFRTRTGMVMEEISTTHRTTDSAYLDSSIPSDPARRKTVVKLQR